MFDVYEDPDIRKIQDLLNDGYKITEKRFSHKNGLTTDELDFAKGNKTTKLTFRNPSKELSKYISSIQFAFDQNYRRIAIFVDPNEFYSDRNILRPGKLENSYIEIGGGKFTEFEFLNLHRQVNTPSRFRFSLDTSIKENHKFFEIDFRLTLKLYISNEIKFQGYIVTFLTDGQNKRFNFICEDPMGLANLQKIGLIQSPLPKGYGSNVVAFLSDLMGLNYSTKSIQGLDDSQRDFLILVPIQNFDIGDSLDIGSVEITPSISDILFLSDKQIFHQFKSFAKVVVRKQNSIFSAIEIGLKMIESAINIINLRIRFPVFLHEYHYSNPKTAAKPTGFIYLKDVKYNAEIGFKKPWFENLPFENDILVQKYFNPVSPLMNIVNEDFENSQNNLLIDRILHYLNLAETNTDRIKGFLDIWIALDFTIVRFFDNSGKRFGKAELNLVKSYCENFAITQNSAIQGELNEGLITKEEYEHKKQRNHEITSRLVDLLNMFNQRSLNEKLNGVLDKYDIELSADDWSNYRSARKLRNDIVHGRKQRKPKDEEYNILSKIIYLVLRNAILTI